MPSNIPPEERTELARVASYASWRATPDRSARTAPARAAALAKKEQATIRERDARTRLTVLQARRRMAEATEAVAIAEQQLRDLGLEVGE